MRMLSLFLKVVGNENLGGSRGWLLVEGDTGLWRSMCLLFNVAVIFSSVYFRFLFVKLIY
jgi:hypothetical protein